MTGKDEPLLEGDHNAGLNSQGSDLDIRERIERLAIGQPYAVLCTQGEGQPYGALVAFAFTDDLKQVVFATPKATRKYRTLSQCDHVALVIDNRPDQAGELMDIEAVTATGRAVLIERVEDDEFKHWADLLVARHAYLKDFAASPSCALFRIDIVRYFHVVRFQEVRQWIP